VEHALAGPTSTLSTLRQAQPRGPALPARARHQAGRRLGVLRL